MENKVANLVRSAKDLASLVKIEQLARQKETIEELYDFIIHQTRELVAYDVGALWIRSTGEFVKFSDVDLEDKSAPIVDLLNHIVKQKHPEPITKLTNDQLKEHYQPLAKECLFKNTLIIELKLHQQVIASLIISRDEVWHKRDMVLLEHIRFCYALCLGYLQPNIVKKALWRKWFERFGKRKILIGSLGSLLLASIIIHVPITVLAPAEVAAQKPVFIRSAIEGVIDKIYVEPNVYVEEGTKLFSLNKEDINAQLNIAEKKLALAQTQYNVASKSGVADIKQKQKIPALKKEVEKTEAEIEYYQYLLSQTDIVSPKAGLIIFDHIHKMEGKPIRPGETVMLLANEQESALDVFLPVSDAVSLDRNAEVLFFLNTSPNAPLKGQITYASYQANVTPEGVLAYHVRADFNEDGLEQKPRIGLRGTAKLYGDDVSLLYYLLRRPLSYFRQKTGL